MQIIEINEYGAKCEPAPGPTPADKTLAAQLAAGGELGARLEVRWLADGKIEVQASSWVGVVCFSGVEIRVLPKLVGGDLKVLQMIEYTRGLDLLKHLPEEQQLATTGNNLFELIVMILVIETKRLLRDGLLRDYRPTEETLPVMRGRLRLRDQFLKRYGALHQLECSFDEYDGDVAENQLLAVALRAAAARLPSGNLRNETRILGAVIGEVCQPRSADPSWYERRISHGRRNARYKTAHELSLLILRGLAVDNLHTAVSQGVNAFMINMNAVFERFVSRLIDDALSGTNLSSTAQRSIRAVIVDESTNHTYSNIRPDLIIADSQSGRRIPVDIKYKLYETAKFASADIYQLFTYAYALGGNTDDKSAGLIYAAATQHTGAALRIMPSAGVTAARLRSTGLGVAAVLDELSTGSTTSVRSRIRQLIEEITGLSIG